MLAVLLFGPPGAGKGTQAAAVAAASGMPHIATGDMFREHLRAGTPARPAGARATSDSGALVPDDVTIGMLAERISQPDAVRGFVLDGYPRNLDQAGALDRMLRRARSAGRRRARHARCPRTSSCAGSPAGSSAARPAIRTT